MDVDCFVFWSKNPRPFFRYLEVINEYPSYFHFTLNSYPKFLEPNLPAYQERIDTFRSLSEMTNPQRVILRYDPVIISDLTDYNFHLENIEKTFLKLSGYTKRMVLSFVTPYKKLSGKFADLKKNYSMGIKKPDFYDVEIFAKNLLIFGDKYNIDISSCCDPYLADSGIKKGACIDGDLIKNLSSSETNFKKDSGQRNGCMCVKSVDMGVYNTCSFDCAYCYANHKRETVLRNLKKYSSLNDSLIN